MTDKIHLTTIIIIQRIADKLPMTAIIFPDRVSNVKVEVTDSVNVIGTLKVAALVDSGSSINIMSKSLFDSVSDKQKLSFEQLDCSEIRLANNDTIKVTGTAKIKLYIETRGEIDIDVYILPVTSHPFILGTDYLMKNNVVLDFSKMSCQLNTANVQTHKRLSLEPNTETIVWARVPNYITLGLQGVPNLQELTESFSEVIPNFISSIDLSSGFFQMGLSNDSSQYTAFNTCFGTYKFSRLPMGLKTAPNTFQMLMDKVLHGLKFKSCLCYLDDVLIFSDTFEKHLSDLKEVFQRFRAAGLKLGPKKCSFAASSCVFLGHLISKDGIRPPPDRVKAISDYPRPKNIKELRRLLGLFNWFRKFIPNYSALVFPLTRLLKKSRYSHGGVNRKQHLTI
ncbi:Retrovirus-related Pol polyprotein from transposon 17.6,Retrovirus-related Pol polyprotein from transposon 297 [Mytilus edulis]|uniref:Retrovirus-related Pol polyprotein from transposon 17.6,Retrovirus-related Pol polyprotein from transposon 297 n=1 Tax=Mytilus edulis TaxID=6550 RepID=A0A8S3UR19_MYTED|nr:Retrovirus-related Pol polyprotein from transposon 17.6,Retrovirus-related Pol polyprotein from transposon 297 [Mytilus edulis]